MSIVRQGTLPVGSLDHAITLNVQSSGGSHFETVTNTTPYLHRASPQDVASSMKLKKVVGGTIAWDQLMENILTSYNNNGVTASYSNGVYTFSGTATNDMTIPLVKYLRGYFFGSASTYFIFGNGMVIRSYLTPQIYEATTSGQGALGMRVLSGTNVDGVKFTLNVFDLTQMFGSTIADYIYSLEQAHAGDGVAWFKALFGEDYYPYNAGELLSVKTSARKTYNADNVEIGSYPLDDDLELRGIPKLDGNNELYYDGDTYASDGTVTRKYGIVDLGSLTWVADGTVAIAGKTRFTASLPNSVVSDTTNGIKTFISNGLPLLEAGGTYFGTDGYTIAFNNNVYIFVDSLSTGTASAFKTAMSGVYLVYELATSTTESADAYTESQRVGATEEFVDGRTVEIPVGNVSEYKRLIQED